MTVFFICAQAHAAEEDFVGRVGDIFESIAGSLQQMGKRSEDIVKPPFGPWRDFNTGPMPGAASYPFEELFPVRSPATIIIDNEFGEVRVNSWTEQVVQVNAEISVGAETTELAHQIARSIDIRVTPRENGLSIRTLLPDTREMGRTRIEVNYVLTIPRDASVVCRNHFGDTLLQQIGGNVAVDSAYGVVELRNIEGEVNVRARGEALQAHGLAKGGTFELLGSQAEFSNISGTLRATNFMGSVVLRKLGTEADVDITNANGPVHMYVSEFDAPDLECEVLFGKLRSHIPLEQNVVGDLVYGRNQNVESKRRVALRTSFDEIRIVQEGRTEFDNAPSEDAKLFESVVEEASQYEPGMEIVVDAIIGTVRIEGTDERNVQVMARKHVLLQSTENAPAALEALGIAVEKLENRLQVRSTVRDDMSALGCSYYRVDLLIRVPRTAPVTLRAQNGDSIVRDLNAPLNILQAQGRAVAEKCLDTVEITNQKGDVQGLNCTGSLTVTATKGTVTTRSIAGPQQITCTEGKTVADAPLGPLTIRQHGGDVRIIALGKGIQGNYDISSERGDISIVIAQESDASFYVETVEGEVHCGAFPLQGSIEGAVRKFAGRLNQGRHTVKLQANEGDVIID
ncbi:MAG: DUF4097 family beta strand repeat-containing protein [Candidatus Hydrogenedentota bacterium]